MKFELIENDNQNNSYPSSKYPLILIFKKGDFSEKMWVSYYLSVGQIIKEYKNFLLKCEEKQ